MNFTTDIKLNIIIGLLFFIIWLFIYIMVLDENRRISATSRNRGYIVGKFEDGKTKRKEEK